MVPEAAMARARRPSGEPPEAPRAPDSAPPSENAPAATPEVLRQRREIALSGRERIIREYRNYGLEPQYSDEARTNVVSLSLLRTLGWRINVVGANLFELVPPAHIPKKRRDRADYDHGGDRGTEA